MMTEERIAKLTSAVYKVTDLFPEKEPLKFVVRRESLDVLFSYVVLISKPTLGQREKSIKKAIASSKTLLHYFDLAELQNWADARNFSILKTEYSNLVFWLEEQVFSLEVDVKKTLDSVESLYHFEKDETDYEMHPKLEVEAERSSSAEKTDEIVFNRPVREDAPIGIESNLINKTKPTKIKKVRIKSLEEDGGEKRGDVIGIKSDVVIDYEELSSIQLKTLEILQNKGFLKASQISKHFEDTSERSVRREIKELKDKRIVVSKGSGKSTFYEINHVY
jgi:DNA-binding transcriptional ArsR family regulator